ncbi:hypothetical protein GC163_17325 [bacterium]|nr:hypothetical protein [bacterium]
MLSIRCIFVFAVVIALNMSVLCEVPTVCAQDRLLPIPESVPLEDILAEESPVFADDDSVTLSAVPLDSTITPGLLRTFLEGFLGLQEPLSQATLGGALDISAEQTATGSGPCGGTNDRKRVSTTTTAPWTAVCSLEVTYSNGEKLWRTGFFKSQRTIVTTGEAVYDHRNNRRNAVSIRIIPGQNGSSQPLGSVTAIPTTLGANAKFQSFTKWIDNKDPAFNIGFITMNTALFGTKTGVLKIATPTSFSGSYVIAGYPGDKAGQLWTTTADLKFKKQPIPAATSKTIIPAKHDLYQQSGSPMWTQTTGTPTVIAIATDDFDCGLNCACSNVWDSKECCLNRAVVLHSGVLSAIKGLP